MFIDLLSESCEEGGGGGISPLGNEDGPIFRGYLGLLPDQPEFLASCLSYKLIGLGMPSYLGSVRQESIVMIIKHHTYTHCTFRLYINT